MGEDRQPKDKVNANPLVKATDSIASFEWYSGESRRLGLPPRCPIAHVEFCPRYFESRWLLGTECGFTKIPPERDAELREKWKVYGSVTGEEAADVWGDGEEIKNPNNFCPEVAYDAFGYFASSLNEYADDLDRDLAYDLYKKGKREYHDFRWQRIIPRHYTECREYSLFAPPNKGKAKSGRRPGEVTPKRRYEVFRRDGFKCVYCGRKSPEVALHVDHRVSIKEGGTDEMDNLVTACDKCNAGKGASSLPDPKPPGAEG